MSKENKKEYIGYFIGSREIKDYVIYEDLDQVGILYVGDRSEDVTKEQFHAMISKEQYGDGEVSIRKYEGLIKRILQECLDARLNKMSFGWVLDQVSSSVEKNFKDAIAKLFHRDDVEKIELGDLDYILKNDNVSPFQVVLEGKPSEEAQKEISKSGKIDIPKEV